MRSRLLLGAVILCLSLAGTSVASAAKFQLKITRIQLNTVKNHHHDVHTGSTA